MTSESLVFAAVEFGIADEQTCFGEFLAAKESPLSALCVHLHDDGADLESLRWLAVALHSHGVSQLLVDLPGHGLSSGTVREHLASLLESVYEFAEALDCRTVSFVAMGSTAHDMLLTPQLAEPLAGVVIAPRSPAGRHEVQHESWERVPKLAFVPNDDAAGKAFSEAVMKATHAWSLRATLALSSLDDDGWSVARTQIASITAKFLLEQIAFADGAAWRSAPPDPPNRSKPTTVV